MLFLRLRWLNCLTGLGSALLLVLSTSCGVYVPHVAPMPVLSRGGVDAQAAVLPLLGISRKPGGFELTRPAVQGYVAYSPINHFFVTAMGGGNTLGRLTGDQSYGIRERQGDLGVGTYTWLTPNQTLYLAGMVGGGSGLSSRIYKQKGWGILNPVFSPLFGNGISTRYLNARYQRRFAQGQVSLIEGGIRYTFSLRVSEVRYHVLDEWRLTSAGPVSTVGNSRQPALPRTLYLEPGYAIRFGEGAWQGTVEGTLSGRLTRSPDYGKSLLSYNASVMAVGIAWCPGRAAR